MEWAPLNTPLIDTSHMQVAVLQEELARLRGAAEAGGDMCAALTAQVSTLARQVSVMLVG